MPYAFSIFKRFKFNFESVPLVSPLLSIVGSPLALQFPRYQALMNPGVTPGRSRAEQLQGTTRGDAMNRSSRRHLARKRMFAGNIEGEFNEAGEWFAFLVGTTLLPFVHHSLSCFKPTRLTASRRAISTIGAIPAQWPSLMIFRLYVHII